MRKNISKTIATVIVMGATLFVLAAVVAPGRVDANYLTKCSVSKDAAGGSVVCKGVKKAKGKDKLGVVAIVRCTDGSGLDITIEDRTPAKALEHSNAYCPPNEGLHVESVSFRVVVLPSR